MTKTTFSGTINEKGFVPDDDHKQEWVRREKWCQCDQPFANELEAITGLLIEGYVSVIEAMTMWLEFKDLVDDYMSLSAEDWSTPHKKAIARDSLIAVEFIQAIDKRDVSGINARKEVLRQTIQSNRSQERDV